MADAVLWAVTVNGSRCWVWADTEATAIELAVGALHRLSGAVRGGRPKASKVTASVASKDERDAVLRGARRFDQVGAISAPTTDQEG